MKKTTTLSSALLITLFSFSQNRLGLFAGPQATSSLYTVQDVKQKNNFKYSFHAGVCMKVPFEGNLFFAPEAYYSMKGYKVTFTRFVYPPGPEAKDNNTSIHTFELAALLQYDLGKNPGHCYIKGGPSLDFQLFGREKFNTASAPVSRKMKYSLDGDYGYFGANLLVKFGYETSGGMFISLNYTHGVGSLNNSDGGPRIFHRVAGLSIGTYLRHNKINIDTKNKE